MIEKPDSKSLCLTPLVSTAHAPRSRSKSAARHVALSRRLPGLRLLTATGNLEHCGRDWTRRWTPAPLAITLPASAEEVPAIVRWANEQGVAIVPSGGCSGLDAGVCAISFAPEHAGVRGAVRARHQVAGRDPATPRRGSISAEHGIGLVWRAYVESTRSTAEIALMRSVRQVFGPRGVLNLGKLFDAG